MNKSKIILTVTCLAFACIMTAFSLENGENIKAEHQSQVEELEKEILILENKILNLEVQLYEKMIDDMEKEKELKFYESVVNLIEKEGGIPKHTAQKIAKVSILVNREYSKTYGYEEDISKLLSFIMTESRFNPNVESSAGAKGLMQIMDSTGKPLAKEIGLTKYNSLDIEQNIRVGWYYYNKEKERLGEDKATVAYNQGYANLSKAVSYSKSNSKSYWSKIDAYDKKYSNILKDYIS